MDTSDKWFTLAELATNLVLRGKVEADLVKKYSPEQISGRLKFILPDNRLLHTGDFEGLNRVSSSSRTTNPLQPYSATGSRASWTS